MAITKTIEAFLLNGCGRCSLTGTPACKIHLWDKEVDLLRNSLSTTRLKEEMKWGFPTYTLNGKNVAILHVFKHNVGITFFKGSLLKDELNLLQAPTDALQEGRQFRFTSFDEIQSKLGAIENYIEEAIALEENGIQLPKRNPTSITFPEELLEAFEEDTDFEKKFRLLTPGRQRGYVLYYTSAKQRTTRIARIERSKEAIFNGKGLNEY